MLVEGRGVVGRGRLVRLRLEEVRRGRSVGGLGHHRFVDASQLGLTDEQRRVGLRLSRGRREDGEVGVGAEVRGQEALGIAALVLGAVRGVVVLELLGEALVQVEGGGGVG